MNETLPKLNLQEQERNGGGVPEGALTLESQGTNNFEMNFQRSLPQFNLPGY